MKKLRIYLDYNRLNQRVIIYWNIVDEYDFVFDCGMINPHERYTALFDTNFASAILALNYAYHIMMIASKAFRERDDVKKTEIYAMENDKPYKPIEFDNPFNIGWFFKWGGAI